MMTPLTHSWQRCEAELAALHHEVSREEYPQAAETQQRLQSALEQFFALTIPEAERAEWRGRVSSFLGQHQQLQQQIQLRLRETLSSSSAAKQRHRAVSLYQSIEIE